MRFGENKIWQTFVLADLFVLALEGSVQWSVFPSFLVASEAKKLLNWNLNPIKKTINPNESSMASIIQLTLVLFLKFQALSFPFRFFSQNLG